MFLFVLKAQLRAGVGKVVTWAKKPHTEFPRQPPLGASLVRCAVHSRQDSSRRSGTVSRDCVRWIGTGSILASVATMLVEACSSPTYLVGDHRVSAGGRTLSNSYATSADSFGAAGMGRTTDAPQAGSAAAGRDGTASGGSAANAAGAGTAQGSSSGTGVTSGGASMQSSSANGGADATAALGGTSSNPTSGLGGISMAGRSGPGDPSTGGIIGSGGASQPDAGASGSSSSGQGSAGKGTGGTGGKSAGGGGTGGATVGGASTASTARDLDLVLRYKFDETSGTTPADASGNARNGKLVTTGTGSVGYSTKSQVGTGSVILNGSNSNDGGYVEVPMSLIAMGATTEVTLTCWVNVAIARAWQRVFEFGSSSSTSYLYLTVQQNATTPNAPRFAITTSGNGAEQRIDMTTPAALSTATWHHLAVVLGAGSTYTGTLYIDGVVVGTNSSMTLRPSALKYTSNNWLGRSESYGDSLFNGMLDDFRIYKRALTPTEIAAIFAER